MGLSLGLRTRDVAWRSHRCRIYWLSGRVVNAPIPVRVLLGRWHDAHGESIRQHFRRRLRRICRRNEVQRRQQQSGSSEFRVGSAGGDGRPD